MELKPLKIGEYLIEKPIIQGGMGVGISWDQLAGSVSKEGGLGVVSAVGTGYYQHPKFAKGRTIPDSKNFDSDEALAEIILNAKKICENRPLAVNVMYAQNSYERTVKAACNAGADIIISGAGLATKLAEFTKDYPNVALIPIVSSARALKLICMKWKKKGKIPDAVVVEGPKSGGHQGFHTIEECNLPENQLEIIVPQVIEEAKKWGDIPIIAAGGIWDKTDIEKILSIGASAVQMGTRFVTTFESNASEAHKQALLNAKESDISLKPSPVGLPSRSINSNLHILIKEKLAPEIKCISNCVAPCKQGVGAREVGYCIADRLGDRTVETGLFFTGTNGYRCNEILSVHDLMKKLTEGEKSV